MDSRLRIPVPPPFSPTNPPVPAPKLTIKTRTFKQVSRDTLKLMLVPKACTLLGSNPKEGWQGRAFQPSCPPAAGEGNSQGSLVDAPSAYLFNVHQLHFVDLRYRYVVLGSNGESALGGGQRANRVTYEPPGGHLRMLLMAPRAA